MRWIAASLAAGLCCGGAAGQTSAPAGAPQRFTAGFELRGRFERKMGLKYTPGDDDTYYLQRLRIDLGFEPNRRLRFFVQAQDAHAPAFSRKPVPASFQNTFDLRQGYAEVGRIEADGSWGIRAGRQELRFGDARLIGPSNWSNNARSWDAVRAAYKTRRTRLDAFAAALVPAADGRFDHPALRDGFYGLYSSTAAGAHAVDAYLLWKTGSRVQGESGRAGDLDVYTSGVRAAGRCSTAWTCDLEIAIQTGHYATDAIRAWAGHWRVSRPVPTLAWKPQLIFEYNYASGDDDRRDGRRGTFDQLFPSNRDKYGTADRITWRNIHNLRTGVRFSPLRSLSFDIDLHNFWLASRSDGLYTDSGRLIARNPDATSSYVGPEFDIQATWQASQRLQIGFGYARLFAGGFLRQSIPERGSSYPYVMWTYRH